MHEDYQDYQEDPQWGPPGALYQQTFSRSNRGLLVFLLDQSRSMKQQRVMNNEKFHLAEIASYVINEILVAIIDNAEDDPRTGRRKDYCDIIIFGYGNTVKPLLNPNGVPIPLPDLAEKPQDYHIVVKSEYDSNKGEYVDVEKLVPLWIKPELTEDKRTEMVAAINKASEVVERWIAADERRKHSFPPVVINITDGRHNGEQGGDPVATANNLRKSHTNDGNVLLFNCHITASTTPPITFPSRVEEFSLLTNEKERLGAQQLFQMSSEVPASMLKQASKISGRELKPGSRGLMYNASGEDLVRFLTWGTAH